MADDNNQQGTSKPGAGWHGDSQGHSKAGQKGGTAAQQSGNAHQLTSDDRSKGGEAAQQSGNAHQLTDEERSKGGQIGGSR
jgi:hypothetical protein